MLQKIRLFFVLFLISFSWQCVLASDRPAFVIPVQGGIGPAMTSFVSDALSLAAKRRAAVAVIELNTPGGLLTATQDMVRFIVNAPLPVVVYVAPPGASATSAGLFVTMAAHIAVMAPGTRIGASTPVMPGNMPGQEKQAESTVSALEKKAVNDTAAYARSLAQLRGRNVRWAESAVRSASSITAKEALQLRVIDAVQPNLRSLLQGIDGQTVALKQGTVRLQTASSAIAVIQPNWRHRFLQTLSDPTVAYALLMLGLFGLVIECFNPGLIFPGVLGGIFLLTGVYALQMLPIDFVGVALMLLGMALMVLEVFVMSYGIFSIGGLIAFVIGSIMLIKHMPGSHYHLSIVSVICFALFWLAFCVFFLQMIWRSQRRRVVSGVESLIGETGRVVCDNGRTWVRVAGERWQVSSSDAIQTGDRVRVCAIDGLMLQVELCDEGATTDHSST